MLTRFRIYLSTCLISAILCAALAQRAAHFNKSYTKLEASFGVESCSVQIIEIGRTIEFRVIRYGQYERLLSIPF